MPPASTSTHRRNSKNGLWGIPLYPHWDFDTNYSIESMYTNAHSIGNKQEELESCVQSQSFDLIAIIETLWNSSCDWNVVLNSCKLFGKDRLGMHSGGVALYVRWRLECIRPCLGVNDEQIESLWVRIKGQSSKGDAVVGVYRLLLRRSEWTRLCTGSWEHPHSHRPWFLGGISTTLTVLEEQHRKVQTAREDPGKHWWHSLTGIVGIPTRNGVVLNLMLKYWESLVGNGSDMYQQSWPAIVLIEFLFYQVTFAYYLLKVRICYIFMIIRNAEIVQPLKWPTFDYCS